MTTRISRSDMIKIVLTSNHAAFRCEIEHQMGIEREYQYDAVSALFDTEDRAETWFREGHDGARSILKEARRRLIGIGFYRAMTAEETENTVVSGGRTPWAFRDKGIAYTNDDPAEMWMFPDGPETVVFTFDETIAMVRRDADKRSANC